MTTHRDYTPSACRSRAISLGAVAGTIWKRHRTHARSAFSDSSVLLFLASRIQHDITEHDRILDRSNRISITDFAFNFNSFGDHDCLYNFRFTKVDVIRMMYAVAWPEGKTCTTRNRYAVSSILATCLVLRRIASPARWSKLELMFGKHRPELSEIYWEALEYIWDTHHDVMTIMSTTFLQERASTYAEAVYRKSNALDNCIGFTDGTVIGIARPKGYRRQKVVYNGHKRKHSLKYQAINTPDGLILNACRPMEGRRHDWTLYINSGLDDVMLHVLKGDGRRFCIYGDSGYNRRWYLEVPFQGRLNSTIVECSLSSIQIDIKQSPQCVSP